MLKMSMSLAQNADDGYETSPVEHSSDASAESLVHELLSDAESAIPNVTASAVSIESNNASTSSGISPSAENSYLREDPWYICRQRAPLVIAF